MIKCSECPSNCFYYTCFIIKQKMKPQNIFQIWFFFQFYRWENGKSAKQVTRHFNQLPYKNTLKQNLFNQNCKSEYFFVSIVHKGHNPRPMTGTAALFFVCGRFSIIFMRSSYAFSCRRYKFSFVHT